MLPDDLRAALDADRTREAGAQFVEIIARYYEQTGRADDAVSPTAGHPERRASFDEAMPRDGQPLADIVARIERDFLGGANRLSHPMYMGHQVAATSRPRPSSC